MSKHHFCNNKLIVKLKMDFRKGGIRLRHLETQKEKDHDGTGDHHSPSNRRKIFNSNLVEMLKEVNKKQKSKQYSPLKHGYSDNSPSQNQFYEAQVQQLIETLKQKTIEVEKKNETIKKMKKQVDHLRIINESYEKQIARLKALLNQQKQITRTNGVRSTHSQALEGNKIKKSNIEGIKSPEIQYQRKNRIVPRKSFIEENSEQQETLTNIVSPLMALTLHQNGKKQMNIESPIRTPLTTETLVPEKVPTFAFIPSDPYQAGSQVKKYRPPPQNNIDDQLKIENSREFKFDDFQFSGLGPSEQQSDMF